MARALMIMTLATVALTGGCGERDSMSAAIGTSSQVSSSLTDIEAVTHVIERLNQAISERDLDSIKPLYGLTVIWDRDNHPNLAGQSWVVKKYAEHFEQFRADLNVQVVDVIVRQGVATVYTIRSGVIHSSEGGDAIREVHDMVVYTLRNDGVFGKWRIVARLSKGLEEGGV